MGNHGDQFNDYNVTTKDPGPLLLYITILISVALYALLPCLVACANKRFLYLKEREDELLKESKQEQKQDDVIAHAQQQQQQKAYSRENASSSGICDAIHPGKPAKTIPNAWKHTSRLLNSRKLDFIQTGIQSVAKATHQAHDAKRMGMQNLLFHLERTDNPENGNDGDGVMIDSPLAKTPQQQEVSGIFSYNAMKEVHVPVVRTSAIVGGGDAGGRGGDGKNDNYDDDYGDQIPPHNHPHVKEMSPIHPCRRTYYTCRNICKYDTESRRILKLALPYVYQALVMGVAEAGRVGILASMYDTRSMSAYVICVMLVGFTAEFFGAILDSQGVLTAQTIGMGNTKLTGQYTQAGMILFVISVIPITIVWMFFMGPVLRWFGFDEETAQLGVEFTQSYVWARVVVGVDGSLQTLLDISGHEIYSAVFTSLREISITLTILVAALLDENVELKHVGFMFLINVSVFLILNIAYIACMGFWRKYYSGMIYSCALANQKVPKSIISTAIPLSFGYLLTYGEWEILTIFASFIGPAEVAAWGILGTLWDVLEDATEAIAEAAEVRCAFLLGAGKPMQAKLSAYKSILLAFVVSAILSTLVLYFGHDVAQLTTSEETLYKIVKDLIPLFAIGNIALAVGSMAWTLVGAQGRYAYSTAVGFVGSWCVTVPLAAICSIRLGYDLQGQTAAMVIGYMLSGTWNTFTLLRSDWQQISDNVIAYNNAHDIELEEDSDDDDDEENSVDVDANNVNKQDAADHDLGGSSCTNFQCYHV